MKTAEVDALEDCLERLQAGASLEQVLALYPIWAEELRPLLESAILAWSLRVNAPVPEASLARSRALFIEKAVSHPQHRGLFGLGLRFSYSLIAILSTVVVLAVGTSFVSAQSLPGDILYPVKLAGEQTRLLLTTNTTQRLILQERYDQTRADEVENLLQDHRLVTVNFVGLLTQTIDNHWQVAGVNVVFPIELNSTFDQMVNAYVEVTGVSQSDGIVQVSQIHLRELDFSGTINSMTSEMWYVDQVGIRVEDTTEINGVLSVGVHVMVKAYRQEDGTLIARQISLIDSGKQEVQQPPATSQSGENKTESTNGGNKATSTNDGGNFAVGGTSTLANTATSQSAETNPTATDGNPASGKGEGGNVHTPNTPTNTPSDTLTVPSSSTAVYTRTSTATMTATETPTPTPTQTRDGGTKPPEDGGKVQSPTPTSTPTPRHGD
jgi:hypothetical protein